MSLEDKAQEHELAIWEHNNKPRGDSKRYAPGDEDYGPAECASCGDEMPPERRAWGFHICTSCKAEQEHRSRR